MRSVLGLLLAISLVTPVGAAIIDLTTTGQTPLATAQTATGGSTNEADFGVAGRRGAAIFQMRNTAGTATVEMQINCLTGTADYATVANSSTALTVSTGAVSILKPGCRYRASVTACSSCSVTVTVTAIGGGT